MTDEQPSNVDNMLEQQGVDSQAISQQDKQKLKDDMKRGMNKKAM